MTGRHATCEHGPSPEVRATLARQHAHGRRNARALQRLEAHTKALIVERYCPARQAFLGHSIAADFQTRSRAHCKDRPPQGTGLSGVQVTLTAQCRQVYFSPCPAVPKKAPSPPVKSAGVPGSFVPECALGRPWMFISRQRGCQCGLEIRNPCKSRGCVPVRVKDGACGCRCGNE